MKRNTDSVAATEIIELDKCHYQPLEPVYEEIGNNSQVESTEFGGDDIHLYEDLNQTKTNSIDEGGHVVDDDYDDVVIQDYTNLKPKWMS